MNPIVVVGSGMAGYTLARELRKLSADAPLLIITADDAINYSKPVLSNALSGGKHPDQIGMGDHAKMTEQ
ncbi:MAG TPA: FAD-dependent oxidoreductase, partial [Aquirhabdus sp.]